MPGATAFLVHRGSRALWWTVLGAYSSTRQAQSPIIARYSTWSALPHQTLELCACQRRAGGCSRPVLFSSHVVLTAGSIHAQSSAEDVLFWLEPTMDLQPSLPSQAVQPAVAAPVKWLLSFIHSYVKHWSNGLWPPDVRQCSTLCPRTVTNCCRQPKLLSSWGG